MEYVGEVPQVENVVELDRGGQEHLRHPGVEVESRLDQVVGLLLHLRAERVVLQVLVQYRAENGLERGLAGEAQREHAEVALCGEISG